MRIERYEKGGHTWSIGYDEAETILVIVDGGVERVETFASPTETWKRYAELKHPKWFESWTLVEEVDTNAVSRPVVLNARNSELEARLIKEPENHALWCVYGDWLQQQGDPRGEYIALRAAWMEKPHDMFRVHRLKRCEARLGGYLRGTSSGELGMGGFIKGIALTQQTPETLAAPELRFVTTVGIGGWADGAIARMGAQLPATVRELTVSSVEEIHQFEPLRATLARIHTLRLSIPMRASSLESLAALPMPRLRSLEIAAVESSDVLPRALLGSNLPSLKALWLSLIGIDAELMKVIAHAAYAKQLEVLALTFLDDGTAKVLMENADRFPALTALYVDDLRISAEVNHALWQTARFRGLLKFDRSNLVSYPD